MGEEEQGEGGRRGEEKGRKKEQEEEHTKPRLQSAAQHAGQSNKSLLLSVVSPWQSPGSISS